MRNVAFSSGALAAGWLLSCAAEAQQKPYFQGLGMAKGTTLRAEALSADGTIVAGNAGFISRAFRWTRAGGLQLLPEAPNGYSGVTVRDVALDGTVVGGLEGSFGATAFRAEIGEVFDLLPFPVGTMATGISDDASVILLTTDAPDRAPEPVYRWTMDGVTVIEAPDDLKVIIGEALSADGSTIVGQATFAGIGWVAFRWTMEEGAAYLGDLEGGATMGAARAVSHDGGCVVGSSSSASSGSNRKEAFRWTEESGMVALGALPGIRFASSAQGVSANGFVVVGGSTAGETSDAFIWDSKNGMRPLSQVLEEVGLGKELEGWQLTLAVEVSADGRTIIGNGQNPDGQDEPWIAFLGDSPCTADWDRDGSVNSSDFFAFLEDFFCEGKGCDSADFNADSVENSQDFFDFIVAFFTGC